MSSVVLILALTTLVATVAAVVMAVRFSRLKDSHESYRSSATRGWDRYDDLIRRYNAVLEENASHKAKWLEARRLYLEQLSESEALRDELALVEATVMPKGAA